MVGNPFPPNHSQVLELEVLQLKALELQGWEEKASKQAALLHQLMRQMEPTLQASTEASARNAAQLALLLEGNAALLIARTKAKAETAALRAAIAEAVRSLQILNLLHTRCHVHQRSQGPPCNATVAMPLCDTPRDVTKFTQSKVLKPGGHVSTLGTGRCVQSARVEGACLQTTRVGGVYKGRFHGADTIVVAGCK